MIISIIAVLLLTSCGMSNGEYADIVSSNKPLFDALTAEEFSPKYTDYSREEKVYLWVKCADKKSAVAAFYVAQDFDIKGDLTFIIDSPATRVTRTKESERHTDKTRPPGA